jgi:hypothetical protein
MASVGDNALRADPAVPASCLHVFPSFEIGGVQLRTIRIINHLGARLRYTIIGLNGDFEASRQFAAGVEARLLPPRRTKRGTFSGVLAGAGALH